MTISGVLLWFASFTNTTSILVVSLCFMLMTVVILSVNGDYYTGNTHVPVVVKERTMVNVSNPFFLHLQNGQQILTDGLNCVLSALCPCEVVVLWGAKVNPLHDVILRPGVEVREESKDLTSEMYTQISGLHVDRLSYPSGGEHHLTVALPDVVTCQALGEMPRSRYPVVVMTFVPEQQHCQRDITSEVTRDQRSNSETDCQSYKEDSNCIIGMISIIHLSDELVQSKSHIINQYVKTAGVPLYALQPLYMANSEPSGDIEVKTSTRSSSDGATNMSDPPIIQPVPSASANELVQQSGYQGSTEMEHEDDNDNSNDECLISHRGNEHHCAEVQDDKLLTTPSGKHVAKYSEDFGVRRRNIQSELNKASDADASSNSAGIQLSQSIDSDCVLPECVVCQMQHVMCVLLPCRHACVCLACFKLLDKCPLCRGPIESYFLLKDTAEAGNTDMSEDIILEDIQQQAVRASVAQLWENFNTRLNHLIGFR